MSKRKEATAHFLKHIKVLDSSIGVTENLDMYTEYFKSLTDKEFDTLMNQLDSKDKTLPYYYAPLSKKGLRLDTIFKVGDMLKIPFFERIWITDSVSGARYLTPKAYPIMDLPVRRQQEHVSKKRKTAVNSKMVDSWTGQPMGVSAGAKISFTELMILESAGHHKAIEELTKVRGGDVHAFRRSRELLASQGSATLKELEELGTRPTSTETLGTLLKAMHLDNNV